MRAIPNLRKIVASGFLFATAVGLSSCATQKETPLVADPSGREESTIPWNKQEKWETQNGLAPNMTDHR
jgi:hypothetical protein